MGAAASAPGAGQEENQAMKLSELTGTDRRFLEDHQVAAMITVGADGWGKAVKMEPAVVDGRLWSASHQHKVRTRRLRRDPRATLFYDGEGPAWLALEAVVSILDGPEVPHQLVRLMRVRQGRPAGPLSWHGENGTDAELDEDDFVRVMIDEGCLIYDFDVRRAYGNR
jgi:hypothetical protein